MTAQRSDTDVGYQSAVVAAPQQLVLGPAVRTNHYTLWMSTIQYSSTTVAQTMTRDNKTQKLKA